MMRLEMIRGATNVVRFPIERRVVPSLPLLRAIAPDPREVAAVAEAFGLAAPDPETRHASDAATAGLIQALAPASERERQAVLGVTLTLFLDQAIAACGRAHQGIVDAAAAQERLAAAHADGDSWLAPLQERADRLALAAARLLIDAFVRAEQAEGAARAVGIARRGKPWQAYDLPAEADALFFAPRTSAS